METSTIQVEKLTKDLLNELKHTFGSKTYDEVIQTLVKRKTESGFGKFAKKKISVEEMMAGLRDKNDRN
ncbi:MAG: hypothetical protein WCW13_02450 [archaeon]|jgi:hypothetical protein